MAAQMSTHKETSRSGILYRNEQWDIFLYDIPTSIAAAQGRSDILLSTAPLEEPIPLDERMVPKSKKGKEHNAEHLTGVQKHNEYKPLIEKALSEIHGHVTGAWCVPRKLMPQMPKIGEGDMEIDDPEDDIWRSLREWASMNERKEDKALDIAKMMASLGATSEFNATSNESVAQKWSMSYGPARDIAYNARDGGFISQALPTEPWTSSFHNPGEHALELNVIENSTITGSASQRYCFTLPPRSTFYLSDCTHSDAFRASFRELTDEYTLPRHFDLVLLDPPWPNRSAKRKGGYDQVGGMPYIKRMLLSMDIDNYVEHNALVGIWITNKESLREHVLGRAGLFEKWNIGLIEEWIWVKTTIKGEPMFDMENLLRKPYEVLLLGRAAPNSWTTMSHAPFIKKRIIAAVPDVHSRKPCLKELFEYYMPDAKDYSALEIFPRYLVTGWTSWGNEALKFNWDRYWAPAHE